MTVDRGTRAFTLIEVLVALAIASIGLLGLLRLHLIGLTAAQAAAMQTAAVSVAQERNAEVCAAGFPQLGNRSGVAERNGVRFEWTTTVTDARPQVISGQTLQGLREVRTVVSWPQGSGSKDIQMATYAVESRFGG